jgi:hypothetical protein
MTLELGKDVKSPSSNTGQSNCVHAVLVHVSGSRPDEHVVIVRDDKDWSLVPGVFSADAWTDYVEEARSGRLACDPDGGLTIGTLTFTPSEARAFFGGAKQGTFDLPGAFA